MTRPLADLLAHLPPPLSVDPAEIAGGRRLVVLDDDPTGTQAVADVPVVTTWRPADLKWALHRTQGAAFVLTNTRSLPAADASARNREVLAALADAASETGVDYVLASRSDSTLRGHFPLETDVLAEEEANRGRPVDGVVIVPAYPEAGRITVDSVHWMATPTGMLPVARGEFARDASFGYRNSELRAWVEEKTGGRVRAADVVAITCTELRTGGAHRVSELLGSLHEGRPAVVDAVHEDDLRVAALGALRAEAAGARLIYRVGPSFVRARAGQVQRGPLSSTEIPGPPGHGLVVVGSHVGLTSRQLGPLRGLAGLAEFELEVPTLLDPATRDRHVTDVASAAAEAMATADVVIRTSRSVVTGSDEHTSLSIAREVSSALVETVTATARNRRPAWVVAKGGITSSDIATQALGIRRAIVRGTLLPGIVSLWEIASGPFQGTPYVVFAGNVGDDDSLRAVVSKLRRRQCC